MNNRINKLFKEKKKNILSVYFTAGYPELNDTKIILDELVKNGVDLIEIGMPSRATGNIRGQWRRQRRGASWPRRCGR